MFWTFLFPLLMLFGFGVIFRSGGAPTVTLVRVAPPEDSARDRAFLKALEESHLKVVTLPAAEAETRWAKGETTAQLESVGVGYRLRLNSYLVAQGQVAAQAASQAFLVAQARLAGSPEPERIRSSSRALARARRQLRGVLVPGSSGPTSCRWASSRSEWRRSLPGEGKPAGCGRRAPEVGLPPRPDPARVTVVVPRRPCSAWQPGSASDHEPGLYLLLRLKSSGTATFAMGFALSSCVDRQTYAISNRLLPMMLLGLYFRLTTRRVDAVGRLDPAVSRTCALRRLQRRGDARGSRRRARADRSVGRPRVRPRGPPVPLGVTR